MQLKGKSKCLELNQENKTKQINHLHDSAVALLSNSLFVHPFVLLTRCFVQAQI